MKWWIIYEIDVCYLKSKWKNENTNELCAENP